MRPSMAPSRDRPGALTLFFASATAGTSVVRLGRGSFAGCALENRTILPPTTHLRRRVRGGCVMQLSQPKIGRPKTSIKKSVGKSSVTREPEPEAGKGAAKARPRRKTQADEIPMYKVILLGDEEYEEGHVVTQLQKTIQLDKQKARSVFHEAQQTGSSVACVVCEEHAEFYAEQLRRQEIFVAVEKDE